MILTTRCIILYSIIFFGRLLGPETQPAIVTVEILCSSVVLWFPCTLTYQHAVAIIRI